MYSVSSGGEDGNKIFKNRDDLQLAWLDLE